VVSGDDPSQFPDAGEPDLIVATPVLQKGPLRDRYLTPLFLPLLAIGVVIFYVLNMSRLFLAGHGTGAVVVAVTVTLLILVGATLLAAAPRMRTSSVGLCMAGVLVLVLGAGWVTTSSAEEEKVEEVALGPAVGVVEIESFNLGFAPSSEPVPFDSEAAATVIEVRLSNRQAGSHTLKFEDPKVQATTLQVANQGDSVSEKVGFPGEGDFTFYCSIPRHREAGMEGTMTVTSDLEPQPVAEPDAGAGETSAG